MKSFVLVAALAACSSAPADQLDLPGDSFYPESLTAAGDGRLLIGSFGTGVVDALAANATTATPFVTASADAPRTLGVLADDQAGALWTCADDTSTQAPRPPEVRRYDLATGAFQTAYGFPAPAFCNDLALDGAHNLYVTDSTGALYKLAGDHLAVWSRDPLLVPSTPGGFGANGVAWDGAHTLYVSSFADNRLLAIDIAADGSAAPARQLAVTPALSGPDAVRFVNGKLLVVEQTGGRLTQVTTDGQGTVLASGLDQPTSVAVRGGDAFVTQGQLGHILGTVPGPPKLPFVVTRVALP